MIEKTECVFSFWVGMPYSTQVHILYMTASCQTVGTIVVFRDHTWGTPEIGVLSSSSSSLMTCLTVYVCSFEAFEQRLASGKGFKEIYAWFWREKNGLDIPGLLNGLDKIIVI